jgi:hypothetical protein
MNIGKMNQTKAVQLFRQAFQLDFDVFDGNRIGFRQSLASVRRGLSEATAADSF